MTVQAISREVHKGAVYLVADYRGTRYTLSRDQWGWGVSTKRLALGGFNAGGFKRFDTLAEVQANYKAFASVSLIDAL